MSSHRTTRLLKLLGDRGLGLRVEHQRGHLAGADQVEHGGQVGRRRVGVFLDRVRETLRGLVGDAGVDQQVMRDGFGRHHGRAGML